MATPSQLRALEELLSSCFTPAQLHMFLYGLFGQRFVGSLPPHQTATPASYFFEVVQRLEMNGYLATNEVERAAVSGWAIERPGRAAEVFAMAATVGVVLPSGASSKPPQASATPPSPRRRRPTGTPPPSSSPCGSSRPRRASWVGEGKTNVERASSGGAARGGRRPRSVWSLTSGGTAADLAKAVDALGCARRALIRPNIQEQLSGPGTRPPAKFGPSSSV
ncbi:MAG: hypothetical protein IPI35_16535 [Deltaproteobacteria bacterium]|nr:hypothetical protein [Deltaproteobacteria bacterium]